MVPKASLRCARHSCYNFCLVYLHALVRACMRPSRFFWDITSTFMHGFQNNLAQLLSLRSRSAV